MKKFVAIGHVDTGKSSLCGHLLYKCGYIDERSMEKIRVKAANEKMSKWVWARVLDIYEEEMVRGKTHEFTTIDFEHDEKKYQLIDTPGHQKFIRSMIEGISKDVNIAILLVSMLDNEFNSGFIKGTLKEHLLLAKSVGIEYLVIVANKMDLIQWNKDNCNKKINSVIKHIIKDLHWNKNNIRVVPISAFHGTGLVDKNGLPEWYNGESFLKTLDSLPNKQRSDDIINITLCNSFIVNVNILNIPKSIFSSGYSFILHFQGIESEAVIDKIKNHTFLKPGENGICKISIPIKKMIGINMRIILRKYESTIGYGNVIKIL